MTLSFFCLFFLLLLLLLLLLLMRSIDHCPMALQLLAPFFYPPILFWVVFYFLIVLCVPGCWVLFRQRCKSISVGLYTENRNARNKKKKIENFLASSSGEKGRYALRNNPHHQTHARRTHVDV
jgi:hypothetical protein